MFLSLICSGIINIFFIMETRFWNNCRFADTLEKAERFELLEHLYRLIDPMYKKRRKTLTTFYWEHIIKSCEVEKIALKDFKVAFPGRIGCII